MVWREQAASVRVLFLSLTWFWFSLVLDGDNKTGWISSYTSVMSELFDSSMLIEDFKIEFLTRREWHYVTVEIYFFYLHSVTTKWYLFLPVDGACSRKEREKERKEFVQRSRLRSNFSKKNALALPFAKWTRTRRTRSFLNAFVTTLVGPIIDAKCIDGRTFEELDENMFSDCP